jgi:molybdopterin-guanine dinucleotide biosynthesis protein A
MLFAWWRSRREALDLAETLERENERLRGEMAALDTHYARLMELCRALRDVNADLDRKLLEATHGQG